MILSKEEIQRLTGFRQRRAQIRWLQGHGYRYDINGLGDPVVAIAEFNRHLVGGRAAQQEPNFRALNG